MKLKDFAVRVVTSVFCAGVGLFVGGIGVALIVSWLAGSVSWWMVLVGAGAGSVVFGLLGFLLPLRFGTVAELFDLMNPF